MIRRTTGHWMQPGLIIVACAFPTACQDREPTGPRPVQSDPQFYAHNTGVPGCTTWRSCLLDDVLVAWESTVASSSTQTYVITDASTPTTRGDSITAVFQRISKTSGNVLYEGPPSCWYRGQATFPTARVVIQGRNVDCSYTYFTFASYAQIPTPEVVEFERPAVINCAVNAQCPGPFRIKVRLAGSGWFANDETRFYVENAAGTSRSLQYGTIVVDGNTVELTFNSLYYRGPGSRIVVKYNPWGTSRTEDVSEIYLPFDADAADLVVTGEPAHLYSEGEPVTFTASAPGATVVEVLQWIWWPDDTNSPPMTQACAPGVNPCVINVHESGTMQAHARVDGQSRSGDAHVHVSICPPMDPFAIDSAIVDELRYLWSISNPDSVPSAMRERTGFIVEVNGTYQFQLTLRIADACEIRDPVPPSQVPPGTVVWVHTHPLRPGTPLADAGCMSVSTGRARAGPSGLGGDATYLTQISNALGRDIVGYILEHRGLTRFHQTGPTEYGATYFPKCRAWQRAEG